MGPSLWGAFELQGGWGWVWVWGGLCREESELCKLQAAKPGVTDIDLHAGCRSSTLEAGTVSTLAAMHSLLQFSFMSLGGQLVK